MGRTDEANEKVAPTSSQSRFDTTRSKSSIRQSKMNHSPRPNVLQSKAVPTKPNFALPSTHPAQPAPSSKPTRPRRRTTRNALTPTERHTLVSPRVVASHQTKLAFNLPLRLLPLAHTRTTSPVCPRTVALPLPALPKPFS